jgi:hypothetical protein
MKDFQVTEEVAMPQKKHPALQNMEFPLCILILPA